RVARSVLTTTPRLLWAPVAPARGQIAGGQPIPPPESLVRARVAQVAIAAGGSATARLQVAIAAGWHINANPPAPDYMIATVVKVTPAAGVSAGTPRYPAARRLKVAFDSSELSAYDGAVEIELPLAAAADAAQGPVELDGAIQFQACNDQVCLAPAEVKFRLPVTVTGAGRTGAPPAPPPGGQPGPERTGFTTAPPPPGARSVALENPLARALEGGGWAAYLALFLVGRALNLTPSVYPMP